MDRARKDGTAGGGRDGGEVLGELGPGSGRSDREQGRDEEKRREKTTRGQGRRLSGALRGSGQTPWAPGRACALGASSRLAEAFIPGSERPAADCGAGEQLDYC